LLVIASFGVGVGIGIGVDFFHSVFARFLANSIPSLAESSFSWPNAIPLSFSTPIPIPTPTPILSAFLCLSLSAIRLHSSTRQRGLVLVLVVLSFLPRASVFVECWMLDVGCYSIGGSAQER
jgi:hypothetical protein